MSLIRALRHLAMPGWGLRRVFDARARGAIEQAITATESSHGGEIRFAVEHSLPAANLLRGASARERAMQVFSYLGVWNTEQNNGVLIYVLWADRDVEIVADRAFSGAVTEDEWRGVCVVMQDLFARGQAERACVEGIAAVGRLIARHFPATDRNELSNRPVFL